MNNKYEIVVGLEVHAELSTNTKIFCGCKNEFGAEVNTNVCPVCMGLPGTLPVLNEKVVEYGIRMGHALNCTINRATKHDRKNYFYADLPKAYQTTQDDVPLCANGYLDILVGDETRRIGITRLHIEEDTAKLIHADEFGGTLIDFNRCGVPLIEIVSEPDMRSAEEAKVYLETLRTILLYLGISDAKMQEGSIRADVNVSVRPVGTKEYGVRVETKNVSSFSGVYNAIVYEANRQIEVLENGGELFQETRRWDDAAGKNVLMRSKEDAQDYRYFPEPDLLGYVIPEETVEKLKAELPELPVQKTLRYMNECGLSRADAETIALSKDKAFFFDACMATGKCGSKLLSNWVLGEVTRVANERRCEISELPLTVENLVDMIALIENKTISNAAAKTVFEVIVDKDEKPADIVKEKGLAQISDSSALQTIVDSVIAANEKAINDYKGGRTNVLGFLVGQCMKQSKGQGNPAMFKDMMIAAIENS